QRVPASISYLQSRADTSGIMAPYILSASQSSHPLRSTTTTLAGRAARFRLLRPGSSERPHTAPIAADLAQAAVRGANRATITRQRTPAEQTVNTTLRQPGRTIT